MGSLDDDVRDERNVYANSGPEFLLKRVKSSLPSVWKLLGFRTGER